MQTFFANAVENVYSSIKFLETKITHNFEYNFPGLIFRTFLRFARYNIKMQSLAIFTAQYDASLLC